jgi:hypothetical protein
MGAAIGGIVGAGSGTLVLPGVGTFGGGLEGGILGSGIGITIGGIFGDFISNILTREGDLPAESEPNSTDVKDYGNGKGQIRDYGEDGKAVKDFDFGHGHTGAGDPHVHDWDWNKVPPRQPPRPLCEGE